MSNWTAKRYISHVWDIGLLGNKEFLGSKDVFINTGKGNFKNEQEYNNYIKEQIHRTYGNIIEVVCIRRLGTAYYKLESEFITNALRLPFDPMRIKTPMFKGKKPFVLLTKDGSYVDSADTWAEIEKNVKNMLSQDHTLRLYCLSRGVGLRELRAGVVRLTTDSSPTGGNEHILGIMPVYEFSAHGFNTEWGRHKYTKYDFSKT